MILGERPYLVIPILLFISGCAIHAPMSEMLMFQEKKGDERLYQAEYGHAVGTYSVEAINRKEVNEYVSRKYGYPKPNGEHPSYEYEKSLVTQSLLLGDTTGSVAASIALGSNIGMDFTLRPSESYYLTGAAALGNDKQLELKIIGQKRLAYNP